MVEFTNDDDRFSCLNSISVQIEGFFIPKILSVTSSNGQDLKLQSTIKYIQIKHGKHYYKLQLTQINSFIFYKKISQQLSFLSHSLVIHLITQNVETKKIQNDNFLKHPLIQSDHTKKIHQQYNNKMNKLMYAIVVAIRCQFNDQEIFQIYIST